MVIGRSARPEGDHPAFLLYDLTEARKPFFTPRRPSQSTMALMNSSQAAAYLCIEVSTLYGWVHSRSIPFRKHGGKLVFCCSELDDWSKDRAHAVKSDFDFDFKRPQARDKRPSSPKRDCSLKTEHIERRSSSAAMEE